MHRLQQPCCRYFKNFWNISEKFSSYKCLRELGVAHAKGGLALPSTVIQSWSLAEMTQQNARKFCTRSFAEKMSAPSCACWKPALSAARGCCRFGAQKEPRLECLTGEQCVKILLKGSVFLKKNILTVQTLPTGSLLSWWLGGFCWLCLGFLWQWNDGYTILCLA